MAPGAFSQLIYFSSNQAEQAVSGTSADSFKVNYLYALMAVVVALAVEHRSTDRMVPGSNPAGSWAFFLSLSYLSISCAS